MISPLELKPGLRRDVAISSKKLEEREGKSRDNWPTHESSFSDYMERFKSVLNGRNEYDVIDVLQKKTFPVVIDFMSSTDALADLFYNLSQQDKLGIVVGRSEDRTPRLISRDDGKGIHLIAEVKTAKGIVPASVTSWKTWRAIQELLSGRKADLIIESSGLGLDFIPLGSEFHIAVARRAWQLLSSDNGLILAETRSAPELEEWGIDLDGWVRRLNELGIPAKRAEDPKARISRISIQKTPNSPAKLPLLV